MSHSSVHGYVRKYSWRTGPDHLNKPNLANANTTVVETHDVTGSTNLHDGALGWKLTVAKETTLKDRLTVVGDKAIGGGGALTVDEATTSKGNLTVQGHLDLDGGHLAGVHAVSGAKDADTLADEGTPADGRQGGGGSSGKHKLLMYRRSLMNRVSLACKKNKNVPFQ